MAKWYHKVSLDWMKARQHYLTATDVKELLPVTKTGRKRTVTDEDRIKVLSKKLVTLTEDDCVSTGAAARGHILEPYAVQLFKANSGVEVYHADDVLIAKDVGVMGLAFSPDAIDRVFKGADVVFGASDESVIAEVKSYGPERHMVCGCTPKDQLEERWQVAVAMAVSPSIEKAYLLFFNPSMEHEMFVVEYLRAELEDEIRMIEQVEDDWLDFMQRFSSLTMHSVVHGTGEDEAKIIEQIMAREDLNPTGPRSVEL